MPQSLGITQLCNLALFHIGEHGLADVDATIVDVVDLADLGTLGGKYA